MKMFIPPAHVVSIYLGYWLNDLLYHILKTDHCIEVETVVTYEL